MQIRSSSITICLGMLIEDTLWRWTTPICQTFIVFPPGLASSGLSLEWCGLKDAPVERCSELQGNLALGNWRVEGSTFVCFKWAVAHLNELCTGKYCVTDLSGQCCQDPVFPTSLHPNQSKFFYSFPNLVLKPRLALPCPFSLTFHQTLSCSPFPLNFSVLVWQPCPRVIPSSLLHLLNFRSLC